LKQLITRDYQINTKKYIFKVIMLVLAFVTHSLTGSTAEEINLLIMTN